MKLGLKPAVVLFALAALPSIASADGPTAKEWAKSCVQQNLVKPLEKSEAKRPAFSRAEPPPHERRITIASSTFEKDGKGREFMTYSIDARYGDDWHESFTGCVYRGSGKVFIQLGDEYRPAAFILGKNADAVPDVCQAAPPKPEA